MIGQTEPPPLDIDLQVGQMLSSAVDAMGPMVWVILGLFVGLKIAEWIVPTILRTIKAQRILGGSYRAAYGALKQQDRDRAEARERRRKAELHRAARKSQGGR